MTRPWRWAHWFNFANSDYHRHWTGGSDDFYPGEYQKTRVYAVDTNLPVNAAFETDADGNPLPDYLASVNPGLDGAEEAWEDL